MSSSSNSKSPLEDLRHVNTDAPEWFNNAFTVEKGRLGRLWRNEGSLFSWGNPSNPGIILMHGFMAHAAVGLFIAPLLAENYHLAAFDLSGMGDSGWRESYTVLDRVDEAKAVATQLGMTRQNKKPFLVCHSYGGSVGLTAAEKEAELWGGLVVCDMTMLAPDELSDFESYRKKTAERRQAPQGFRDVGGS